MGEKTFVCLHLCVCETAGRSLLLRFTCRSHRAHLLRTLGVKTEFILALHREPVLPLEGQGGGDFSEMLCPLS